LDIVHGLNENSLSREHRLDALDFKVLVIDNGKPPGKTMIQGEVDDVHQLWLHGAGILINIYPQSQ
jgi:hypothetical protein